VLVTATVVSLFRELRPCHLTRSFCGLSVA
jgi:hypothetical protein